MNYNLLLRPSIIFVIATLVQLAVPAAATAQVLEHRRLLENESFWDNRDFDWYAEQIPFFECPDRDITTTYYYRWDLLTKHLTYGSPNSGYSFTEFIDRPFWSGAYGAISCPAGYQLYEARWLRTPRIANDYSRYWLRTPGAQPRNYSTWLADSVWAIHQVHPNEPMLVDLLPDLIKNYEGWEQRHYVPEVGLFWQTGHDDGMEFNILSRQTQDILRGAPSYRPSFNAYMWADAMAIARIAETAGQEDVAQRFTAKAMSLRDKMIELMWDEKRQFFFPILKNDEERDGFRLKALTRTYESGQFAGDPHGRELIGYVPWQFNLFAGPSMYDAAWKKLMDSNGFYADYGPSTVERNDPMFLLQNHCCWWSGQSWPYATTQTLKGLANLLHGGSDVLTADDYVDLLSIYARSHRKDGKPYLAEALHPDTGSFEGHDGYNHSEHYFHSGYCDLVITGLVGLVTRDDDTLEVRPLAPPTWDYFALENVPYRGHNVAVIWDKLGTRYQLDGQLLGAGLHLLVDGRAVAKAKELGPLVAAGAVPGKERQAVVESSGSQVATNFAVNNDGTYYPSVKASYTSPNSSLAKVNDGNYWYLQHPPNRWTCEGSSNNEDWLEVDFGTSRRIDSVKLYVLDDSGLPDSIVRAPQAIQLESWTSAGGWQKLQGQKLQGQKLEGQGQQKIEGHRPTVYSIPVTEMQKLRVTLVHASEARSGLTEIEAWGAAELPLAPLPPPVGNLAYNDGSRPYPKATASYHDRFGGVPRSAIDGITNFLPTPTNRWTSYESPNESDWLEIDFGKSVEFRRVELAIYDDRGGVQRPNSYSIEYWRDGKWQAVESLTTSPEEPAGSAWNSATFGPVESSKLRVTFANRHPARSGVTEVMVWND